MPHTPIQLTESAKKKIPAARDLRIASGLVGNIKTNKKLKVDQLKAAMNQIKRNQK